MSGPSDWVEAQQRRDGWRRAHEFRGLAPGREVQGDWSPASGYAAGQSLAGDPDVRAIFVANDSMALGVLKALDEAGRRIPEGVTVVGFDDIPEAAYFRPSLSSVQQDFSALGRSAVDLALRALAGEDSPSSELIIPSLCVRTSSLGPP